MKNYKPSKYKWNKSSLIDTDIYLKLYIKSLTKNVSVADKQTLFMISKYFTDGAAEVGLNHFQLANYYFEVGEKYYSEIKDAFVKQIIINVYDRSRSYYYYGLKAYDKAEQLIFNSLNNNEILEQKGFEFLIFDRVSLLHNLSKIYFSKNAIDDAYKILTAITCFLIQGKSEFPMLNKNYIVSYDSDLSKIKHSLLCQILFETADYLTATNEYFIAHNKKFFPHVIDSAKDFLVLIPEDKLLQTWILYLSNFYTNKYKLFISVASRFTKIEQDFYGGRPKKSLNNFINLAKHLQQQVSKL
jgi:hypothetical protein